MIRRDVSPTAGGGGFNTTRPDQLKAAESEIEDDDGSFGSRVQKYLRKGDLGTMDHGISKPKLGTSGGGGKMTKELELPDNSEPTAIQKGGWSYGKREGTLRHVADHPSDTRGQDQDQPASQGSNRHGAHDLEGQARRPGEGEDRVRMASSGQGGLGVGPRSPAPGPSGASRQRASGRRRPEQPDRNDHWSTHEAAPPEARLLALARENQWLATQLQLATKSDEERKRDKNAYMAKWRKEHPSGGGGGRSKRSTPEEHARGIAQDTENMPPAMRGVMGGPADRTRAEHDRRAERVPDYKGSLHEVANRPGGVVDREQADKKKMPETDRTGHTAFDWQRAARRQELTGNGMRTRNPDGSPKKHNVRPRPHGVEDTDDGAYDRRPTNESRALTLARQIKEQIQLHEDSSGYYD